MKTALENAKKCFDESQSMSHESATKEIASGLRFMCFALEAFEVRLAEIEDQIENRPIR